MTQPDTRPPSAWRDAYDAMTLAVEAHPLFRRLVREVAVAEQPQRPYRWAWLRRNSRTYGLWTTRGMTSARRGRLSTRAWRLAEQIGDELLPAWPSRADRAARAYTTALHHVRARSCGGTLR